MARTVLLGGVAADPGEAAELTNRGYSFVMIGADMSFLAGAAGEFIAQAKKLTPSRVEEAT